MIQPIEIDASFPEKLECLFKPKRYKVCWGGRGAGRSWGYGRALIMLAANKPISVLCAREFQNSITESVHKLFKEQIALMGLDHVFDVQANRIITRPGHFPGGAQSQFSFEGIKNNPLRIKSYEGVDYCWVEEANKVTKASWDILIPTIRKETPLDWRERGMEKPDFQSEIWLTFNPDSVDDYTYDRFVLHPNRDSFVVHMTYADNPWFPQVLETERLEAKERDEDDYQNIWEGLPRVNLVGAVYAKEIRKARSEGRICAVGFDSAFPVDTFWDLGRADRTAIWFAQLVGMQYRIVAYFEDTGEEIGHYLKHCQGRPWRYGTMWLPHDAAAKRLGSKRTIEEQVRAHAGWNVRIVPRLSLADGINAARTLFPGCWFDELECKVGLRRLSQYKYKVSDNGAFSNVPLHDDASDGADAFRYMGIALKQPRGRDTDGLQKKLRRKIVEYERTSSSQNWLGV